MNGAGVSHQKIEQRLGKLAHLTQYSTQAWGRIPFPSVLCDVGQSGRIHRERAADTASQRKIEC